MAAAQPGLAEHQQRRVGLVPLGQPAGPGVRARCARHHACAGQRGELGRPGLGQPAQVGVAQRGAASRPGRAAPGW